MPQNNPFTNLAQTMTLTESLVAELPAEDWVVQTSEDASPLKWHLGHTAWFLDAMILRRFAKEKNTRENYDQVFNSYYEGIGTPENKSLRGHHSRPLVQEILDYRHAMRDQVLELASKHQDPELAELVELAIQHEQQHQELLLMDLKNLIAATPWHPGWSFPDAKVAATKPRQAWLDFLETMSEIGAAETGFSFDNERPQHEVKILAFQLSNQLVSNVQYLEFIEAGGYARPELWHSDGWAWRRAQRVEAPLYWEKDESAWRVATLWGRRPLEPDEPVSHLSYYEASAFAAWCGARLPTEFEWERAASTMPAPTPTNGVFLESEFFRALPPSEARRQGQCHDLAGNLWEWTSSPYIPYPGFKPFAGAVSEYNGKFMVNQIVLRGGSFATPLSHWRPSYRNFYYPHHRWQFAGLRLAKDVR